MGFLLVNGMAARGALGRERNTHKYTHARATYFKTQAHNRTHTYIHVQTKLTNGTKSGARHPKGPKRTRKCVMGVRGTYEIHTHTHTQTTKNVEIVERFSRTTTPIFLV